VSNDGEGQQITSAADIQPGQVKFNFTLTNSEASVIEVPPMQDESTVGGTSMSEAPPMPDESTGEGDWQ
jgi:hypothetical protein